MTEIDWTPKPLSERMLAACNALTAEDKHALAETVFAWACEVREMEDRDELRRHPA